MSRAKRKYDSSLRRTKAQATKSRVIRSAGELFVDRGYTGTSIREIAERAVVSQETVYAAFGSKASLLMRWIDVQVVGDEEPVPLIDRPWVGEMRDERTVDGRLAILAEHGAAITCRAEPAIRVLRAAAQSDPQLADMLAEAQQGRRDDNVAMLEVLIGDASLRAGLDKSQAADWLWAITSDEVFTGLVRGRGWTLELYRTWIEHTIRSTLFES